MTKIDVPADSVPVSDKSEPLGESGSCERTIRVLVLGPWHRREFATALAEIPASASWTHSPGCAAALASLAADGPAPELILIAESLPGSVHQREVDQLRQIAPLARLVVIAGTWCEGELRTGKPLSGVLRFYWYELPAWWETARREYEQGLCPSWSAPVEGGFARRTHASIPTLQLGPIAIDCCSLVTFGALVGALKPYGADCHWTRRGALGQAPARLAAGIWDGGQLDAAELVQLQDFAAGIQKRGGQAIALLHFPRREHVDMVRHAGCRMIVAKPYNVRELFTLLCE